MTYISYNPRASTPARVRMRACACGAPRVRGARCAVRGARCAVRGARCAVRGARCAVRGAQCAVRSARCAVRGAQCAVRSARCAVHGARCTVRGVRCLVHGARCMVCGARCAVWGMLSLSGVVRSPARHQGPADVARLRRGEGRACEHRGRGERARQGSVRLQDLLFSSGFGSQSLGRNSVVRPGP